MRYTEYLRERFPKSNRMHDLVQIYMVAAANCQDHFVETRRYLRDPRKTLRSEVYLDGPVAFEGLYLYEDSLPKGGNTTTERFGPSLAYDLISCLHHPMNSADTSLSITGHPPLTQIFLNSCHEYVKLTSKFISSTLGPRSIDGVIFAWGNQGPGLIMRQSYERASQLLTHIPWPCFRQNQIRLREFIAKKNL